MTCWHSSTAGSPRALTRPISRRPRHCWKHWRNTTSVDTSYLPYNVGYVCSSPLEHAEKSVKRSHAPRHYFEIAGKVQHWLRPGQVNMQWQRHGVAPDLRGGSLQGPRHVLNVAIANVTAAIHSVEAIAGREPVIQRPRVGMIDYPTGGIAGVEGRRGKGRR